MIYDVNGNALTTDSTQVGGVLPDFQDDYILHISSPSSMYSTASALYDAYDTMLANVTHEKNLLGYGTNSSGAQDTSLPIYEYVLFNPIEPSGNISDNFKIRQAPKLCLTSGIHGSERSAAVSLFNVVSAIVTSADNASKTLRDMCHFRIVPIINPGGYNDNTRNNRHNVNINRNFLPYWYTQNDADKGSAPYSEYETQALRDWAAAQAPTTWFMVDFHNFAASVFPDPYFYIFTDCTPFWWNAFSVVYRGMRRHFLEQSINLASYPKTQERNLVAGVAAEFNIVHGVDSLGIECPNNPSQPNSNSYVKASAEMQGTFLRYMLGNYWVK